jgi:GNAT superfamily N-acetyltransferase
MATTTMPTPGAKSASATTDIRVVPATPERWPDVETMLGGDLDKGCWCQAWRGRDEIARQAGESRPETLRRQVENDFPPPGYLAYIGDEVVGWCGVSVRTRTPRLINSRTIPRIDDKPVWSIGCFLIRVGHRRKGVATALLSAVIEAAREAGAPGVEAYPIDPVGRRANANFAFVGLASMFDRAGFRRVRSTDAHSDGLPRLLVRLDLEEAGVTARRARSGRRRSVAPRPARRRGPTAG